MGKPLSRRLIAALAAATLAGAISVQATAGETVALFVDNAFAKGNFSASKWNIQGNDGSGWKDNLDNPDKPAASLTLSPTLVTPTNYSYSSYDLRLQRPSSTGASVNMSQGSVVEASNVSGAVTDQAARNTLAGKFLLRVVRVNSSTTCNLAAFTGAPSTNFLIGALNSRVSPLTSPPALNPHFTLSPASESADGVAIRLCFEFGVSNDTAANGARIKLRWTFDGSSRTT